MKHLVLLALLVTWGVPAQGLVRQTLGSTGISLNVNAGTKSYFLWQSVSQQSVIRTFTAGPNRLRQGFIQPLGPPALGETPFGLALTFYPNPFIDQINIDLEQEPLEEVSVSLFDMMGRQVLFREYDTALRIMVDTRAISSGGYLLTVKSGALQNVKQLIKL
ncbi:T9SS type A sorting domain-containing protein [Maribacter sp. 2307UL18-2]|uniref:T9SS type A sorting domain-containing protein n=1 Tax=Maribacter sp. 2307UL18-2 TaxID=3386274 RepID=UPI0039BCFF53